MSHAPRVAPALASLLLPLLAGCGQTGPLYLPEDEGATVITRPGPATPPAPAPQPPGAPHPPVAPQPAPPRAAPGGDEAGADAADDRRPRR
jgi:predicted small lipoprotein YifL